MDFDSNDDNPFAAPLTSSEAIPIGATDLYKVVRSQKLLLYMLLLSIGLAILAFWMGSFGMFTPLVLVLPLLMVIAYVGRIVAVAQLAKAVGCHSGLQVFYIIVMCLSFIWMFSLFGLIVMLMVNGQATKLLKSVGVPVGLMGVSKKNQSLLPAAQARLNMLPTF
jgi:hypothetical protein